MNYDKFRTEIQQVLQKYPGIRSVTIKSIAQYDISIETDGKPLEEVKVTEEAPSPILAGSSETQKTKEELALEHMQRLLDIKEQERDFLKTDLSRPEFLTKQSI